MKNYFFYFLSTVGLFLLLAGCGKDVDLFIPDDPIPEPEPIGNIANFFAAVKPDEVNITYKDSMYCWEGEKFVQLPTGTLLVLRSNDLNMPADCMGRPVQISVKEIDSNGEIIMFGRQTISDKRLIESKGEYYIDITFDGVPVSLKDGRSVSLYIEDENPREQMELFYGTGGREDFNWAQADGSDDDWNTVRMAEWAFQDSLNTIFGYGYECFPDSLVWINVDIFQDVPDDQKTTACVELPEEYTNTNTVSLIVFNDFNAVVGMPGDSSTMQFCEPYGTVPIGYNVTFVTISELGEDCYFLGSAAAIVEQDHLEVITPVKTTLEEIKAFLLTL